MTLKYNSEYGAKATVITYDNEKYTRYEVDLEDDPLTTDYDESILKTVKLEFPSFAPLEANYTLTRNSFKGWFRLEVPAETVYQIYQLTVMDAAARGLKHPKLWGLLAANGNNSSGLLLYLIGRRNYPMNSIDSRQLVVMEKRKKAAGMGLVFVAVGAIGLLVCLGRVGL